jgi:hypothetical protein
MLEEIQASSTLNLNLHVIHQFWNVYGAMYV